MRGLPLRSRLNRKLAWEKIQRWGGGTITTVSPPVLPRWPVAPVSPVVPVAPVSPVCPVCPVYPVAPVVPVVPVVPVAPVAPVAPAGPATGTVTTVAGLSHALKANAISTAENTVAYFMKNSFCMFGMFDENRSPGLIRGRLGLQMEGTSYPRAIPFVGAHTTRTVRRTQRRTRF